MAGVQFAQRLPPQQQGYHQQQSQQSHYGAPIHPQNNHAPQMHMQQQQQQQYSHQPQQQQYMQQNHMGHPQEQMHDQQYYHDHDRVDAKSAGNEQLMERKMQEIQALRFEVESLQKASDPNQSAAQMAETLAKQPDPFNEDSEWNMKPHKGDCCDCCCIQ